jgi:hypothetical protein
VQIAVVLLGNVVGHDLLDVSANHLLRRVLERLCRALVPPLNDPLVICSVAVGQDLVSAMLRPHPHLTSFLRTKARSRVNTDANNCWPSACTGPGRCVVIRLL